MLQRQLTGGFHGFGMMFLGQVENSQTSSVALFRMLAGGQQFLDKGFCMRACFPGPACKPVWRPFKLPAVVVWHVGGLSTVSGLVVTAHMAGNPVCGRFSPQREDFYHPFTGSDFHCLMGIGMGHTVVMVLESDMIVDIDFCPFHLQKLNSKSASQRDRVARAEGRPFRWLQIMTFENGTDEINSVR